MSESPLLDGTSTPKRQLVIELAVVMCLGYLPNMFGALQSMGVESQISFRENMLVLTVWSIQIAVPLLYIMWRSQGGWSEFGIGKPDLLTDGFLTFLLVIAARTFYYFITLALGIHLWEGDFQPPRPDGALDYSLLVVGMTGNSIAEELVMRAYLITRLRQLGVNVVFAVIMSAVLFASYHVYQGINWTVPIAVVGLIFGASFALTRRVWPLVIAHTIFNLMNYVP